MADTDDQMPSRRAESSHSPFMCAEQITRSLHEGSAFGGEPHTARRTLQQTSAEVIFQLPQFQIRDYTYEDGVLTYSVPASASGNGTTAFSVWKRV